MKPFFENHKYTQILHDDQYNNTCYLHFHRNIEIIHVLDGCLDITIRDEKKRLYAGGIAVATSYETHSFVTVGSSAQDIFIIPAEFVPEFVTQTTDTMLSTPFLDSCESTERLSMLLDLLLPLTKTKHSITAIGYVYAILGTIIDTVGLVPRTNLKQHDRILQKMLIYAEDHFRENLLITDIAKHFGYHPNYLSRIFNAGVGCGFNYYVNVLRVRYAKDLLMQSKLTLDEISEASGFQSTVSFRRVFTDYYGKPPYQYYRDIKAKK